ncbi:MAG: serine hydrolase [Chitinophagaceae bacterium]|nr:serine hydrolase [Chitinophagaceae bacterium]
MIRNKLKYFFKILASQISVMLQAQSFDKISFQNPLHTRTDTLVHEAAKVFFEKSHAPGLIIGISREGKRTYYSYGVADKQANIPFDEHTVFEAGSITKTFVSHLLIRLQERKLLSATMPVTEFLPDSLKQLPAFQQVQLLHLASHTSGLPRLPSNTERAKGFELMQPYAHYGKSLLYEYLTGLKKLETGKYNYSNTGYGLLGTVLENATGYALESLLNQYILQPLKMDNSYIEHEKKRVRKAKGYFGTGEAAYWTFDCMAGAGALKSTAADMLAYLEAHYMQKENDFLSLTPDLLQPLANINSKMQIAYGWHILNEPDYKIYWHNGGTFGFSTFAAFVPDKKISVVLAANLFNVNAEADALALKLISIFIRQK